MSPLSWLICGIVLLIMEVAAPGFVIGFFGFGAMLAALVLWLFPSMGLGWQSLVFALSSVLFILLFRKMMKKIFVGDKRIGMGDVDDDSIGQVVTVKSAVSFLPGGRVLLYGTEWSAVSETEIPAGAQAKVVGKDNLTLKVEPVADI